MINFYFLGCGTRADHTVQNHTAVALEHAPRHRVVDTKFAEFNDLTPPKAFNMVQSNWPSSRYPVSPGIHLELAVCISLLCTLILSINRYWLLAAWGHIRVAPILWTNFQPSNFTLPLLPGQGSQQQLSHLPTALWLILKPPGASRCIPDIRSQQRSKIREEERHKIPSVGWFGESWIWEAIPDESLPVFHTRQFIEPNQFGRHLALVTFRFHASFQHCKKSYNSLCQLKRIAQLEKLTHRSVCVMYIKNITYAHATSILFPIPLHSWHLLRTHYFTNLSHASKCLFFFKRLRPQVQVIQVLPLRSFATQPLLGCLTESTFYTEPSEGRCHVNTSRALPQGWNYHKYL